MKNNQQLTSVKVDEKLFNDFKVECVKTKFSLQKLVDRCMHLYVNDAKFRKDLTIFTKPTGSI